MMTDITLRHGDLTPYIPTLLRKMWMSEGSSSMWVPGAIMEIALRSEDHMNKHSAEILSNARVIVQEALMHNWCFILYDYLRLLVQFGLALEESPRCHV